MSPIIDIQRRLTEVGRIRLGRQVEISSGANRGKRRPERLTHFRLTSSSRRALDSVAAIHGGTVSEWKDAPVGEQWELLTDAAEIPVILPPTEMSFSQNYELWSAGGCQRRCDGLRETLTDGPCLCDPEQRECKPHSRLSLLLVGVPGVGLWRLDTQGFYAAAELQGVHELAQMLTQQLGRSVLPGRLRIESRSVKRPDAKDATKVQTRNFTVPVIDLDVDIAAVALQGLPTREGIAAGNGVTPIPALAPPPLAEQLADVEKQEPPRRRNSPPALPRTGVAPRPVASVPEPEPDEPPQQAQESAAQRSEPPTAATSDQTPGMRRLHALYHAVAFDKREDRLAIATLVVGRAIESSKDLSDAELDAVASLLQDHKNGNAHIFKRADGAWEINRPEGRQTELPT